MNLRVSSILIAATGLLLLAAIGFRSYATAQGVPLLAIDARVFLPQALSFHERGELINRVWWPAAKLDRTGAGRMVYHGFLYPMIVGKLMWRGDYLALAGTLALVHGAATILAGLLLLRFAKLWRWRMTAWRWLLIILLTAAGANYTQGGLGRPEALAAIMLMSGLLIAAAAAEKWRAVVSGVTIGLVAATHPVVGVFAGLVFAGYSAWRHPPRRCLLEVGVAGLVSLGVFAACFTWYPYSFSEWCDGTLRMGRFAWAAPTTTASGLNYLWEYTLHRSSWFLGATIPLVLWSAIRMARRSSGPAAPLLFYATSAVAAVAAARLIFYIWWACYNVLPLMPLSYVLVFHELGRERAPMARSRSLYRPVAIAVLALTSLGFALDLYDRAHLLRFGRTLPEARERFAAIRGRYGDGIAMHTSLFTLTEDHARVAFAPQPPPGAAVWIQGQAYVSDAQPPQIPGFRLTEDQFNPNRPALFGVPLPIRDHGCGFALYEREEL